MTMGFDFDRVTTILEGYREKGYFPSAVSAVYRR